MNVLSIGTDASGQTVQIQIKEQSDQVLQFAIPSAFSDSLSYEPRHEKTYLCYMRTTKAQISLRIRAVRSAPFRCLDSVVPLVLYTEFQASS